MSAHHQCARRARWTFTLIELLVVVAIISVLASMLLPVLTKARQRARDLSCSSVQRQVVTGLIMFADDYDGKTPSLRASMQTPQLDGADHYGGGSNGPGNSIWQGFAGRFRDIVRLNYVPVELMKCPSNDMYNLSQLDNMTTHPFSGGVTGQWIYWGTGFKYQPVKDGPVNEYFNRIDNYNSNWPLLMDFIVQDGQPKSKNWDKGAANHDPVGCRGGNITYADGHSTWLSVYDTRHRSPQNGTNNQAQMPIGPDGNTVPIIVYDPTNDRMQYNTQPNGGRVSAATMKLYASGVPQGTTN